MIESVKPEDSAEYTIKVENKAGSDESSAYLKVILKPKEKPEFVEELKSIIINESTELISRAVHKSDLPVTIKWMKDGFELHTDERIIITHTSEGTVTLRIESVRLDDFGKYSVSVINEEGRVRSNATVTVSSKITSKPDIIEGLVPTSFTAGQTEKLSVKVSGEPMPDVRFIKDGQQVIPNDRVHIKCQTFGRIELIFDEVRSEDEGNYIAVAVNDNGEARSSAPVVVNRKPKFEKTLTDTTGIEGYPAKLEVKVDGRPKPEIQWTINGQKIRADDHHIKLFVGEEGTYSLMFDKCTPNDSGTYGVIASNDFGKTSVEFLVKSKVVEIGPEIAPEFITSLQDQTAYEGQTIEFFAEVKANPIPDVEWYFQNKLVEVSENIHISFDGTKSTLRITKCESYHKGLYELKVSNRLGEKTSKASADVIGKSAPKFIKKFNDSEVGISEQLKLECRVTGFPEPDIEWYCNGIRIEAGIHYSIIKEGDNCSLLIVRPTDRMTGVYECIAKNSCRSDSCKANITFM